MAKECYINGSCKLCGCTTTALQMAAKPCDNPCYPEMMSKTKWKEFKVGSLTFMDKNGLWQYLPQGEGLFNVSRPVLKYYAGQMDTNGYLTCNKTYISNVEP